MYGRLIRKNKNILSAEVGPTGCLDENTKLYGQTKTLGELYKEGKTSIKTISLTKQQNKMGCYRPIKSQSIIIPSGKKEVYEIELENGKKVLATSEHRFFVKDGSSFKEVEVKDLRVGDSLRDFDRGYIQKFYDKARFRIREKTHLKYKTFRICSKCNNLFHIPEGNIYPLDYCKICSNQFDEFDKREKKYKINHWFGWEDNLLRNFYYSYPKEKLMKILPLRKTWSSICHQAKRLGLKRNPKFQWEQNAWKSENNPMHNPIIKEKAMIKQIPIYARNKKTSIEKKVADYLDSLHIKYDFNKVVRTKTSFKFPDFQIGNLIIECDGIHWHQQRKNDKQREDELKECGFEIIRFSDKQINNDFEEVKKCIQQKLNR